MKSRGFWRVLPSRLRRTVAWLRPGRLAAAAIGFPLFFVLTTALFTVLRLQGFQVQTDQPVEFNHRLHVEDVGLECTDCHAYYASETFSGMPDADACSFCHEEAQGEDPEEAKLAQLLADGRTLDWRPLFRQPAHVFYSHRRHVTVAKLECEACHGSIAASEAPPRSVDTLSMDDCIECHEQQGVEDDCTSCHR